MLGFAGHTVRHNYSNPPHIFFCSRKAAIDNSNHIVRSMFKESFIYKNNWQNIFAKIPSFLTLGLTNALLRKTRKVSSKPKFIQRPHKVLKSERLETSRFPHKKNRTQRNKFDICENFIFGFCQGFLASRS